MKKSTYVPSKRVKGEVHDILRKRGPRFSVTKDRSKVIPRKSKYGSNKIAMY